MKVRKVYYLVLLLAAFESLNAQKAFTASGNYFGEIRDNKFYFSDGQFVGTIRNNTCYSSFTFQSSSIIWIRREDRLYDRYFNYIGKVKEKRSRSIHQDENDEKYRDSLFVSKQGSKDSLEEKSFGLDAANVINTMQEPEFYTEEGLIFAGETSLNNNQEEEEEIMDSGSSANQEEEITVSNSSQEDTDIQENAASAEKKNKTNKEDKEQQEFKSTVKNDKEPSEELAPAQKEDTPAEEETYKEESREESSGKEQFLTLEELEKSSDHTNQDQEGEIEEAKDKESEEFELKEIDPELLSQQEMTYTPSNHYNSNPKNTVKYYKRDKDGNLPSSSVMISDELDKLNNATGGTTNNETAPAVSSAPNAQGIYSKELSNQKAQRLLKGHFASVTNITFQQNESRGLIFFYTPPINSLTEAKKKRAALIEKGFSDCFIRNHGEQYKIQLGAFSMIRN